MDPELIVTPAQVWFAAKETAFPDVVAMMTTSPVAGTLPPTQVDPVFQLPPVDVEVIVAAELRNGISTIRRSHKEANCLSNRIFLDINNWVLIIQFNLFISVETSAIYQFLFIGYIQYTCSVRKQIYNGSITDCYFVHVDDRINKL